MQLRAIFPVLGQALRNRSGNIRKALALGFLGGAAAMLGGNTTANTGAETSEITVTVTDIRNSKGVVRACLTVNEKKFPSCKGATKEHMLVVPSASTVTLKFKGVKPGRYAIAVLHDANNNDKADRALFLMPKEGYGFSRDAKVRMGPPKFKAAAFDVNTEDQSQSIRMRYMF